MMNNPRYLTPQREAMLGADLGNRVFLEPQTGNRLKNFRGLHKLLNSVVEIV